MAVSALVVTPGSATANAYVSRAVADQYNLDRPAADTTWALATNDQKDAAILWATVLLDRMFVWYGYVINETQRLLWPRAGLLDVNQYRLLDSTTIPTLIQYATAEFARQLLAEDRAGDSDIGKFGLESLKAGSVELRFRAGVTAQVVPDAVITLIPIDWGYLRGTRPLRLVRT
jgi:hypothetical protein